MKTLITILILSVAYSQNVFNTTQGTDYATISEAVQNANPNDYISVTPGTYAESFTIETSINLTGSSGAVINASNLSTAISIMGDNINVSNFEIIGNENTISGFSVNPGSNNINITNNTIHGMGLANTNNESPLSYGIVVWGNDVTPNPPNNVTISGNEIYDIAGTGISLGEITQNITITNNNIHSINGVILPDNIIPGQNLTSMGINGLFSDNVTISDNTFTDLTVGISFGISTGTVEDNTYNNTSIFFASIFFSTESDDGFTFNETEPYWISFRDIQTIASMNSYCSTLELAQNTADDGSTILASDGQEIVQDCSGVWGGDDDPYCGTCTTNLAGDINADGFVDILDVVGIGNRLISGIDFTETEQCLSDMDSNNEINILDIVLLVQSIINPNL